MSVSWPHQEPAIDPPKEDDIDQPRLKVLDLFAGLRGWSDPWKARGHEVLTLDLDPAFDSDLQMDIREFAENPLSWLPWEPDVILASPPCESFSVMTIGRNWTKEHEPKTDKARLALEIVETTVELIRYLDPKVWVMENPRAKLRKLEPVKDFDRVTVTYCQYGEPFMKPTDLWGGFPPDWTPRPMCKPKAPCHVSAARGSRTGIQGEGRWTHPVLLAQSNNGHREDERARRAAGEKTMLSKVDELLQHPTPAQQQTLENIKQMSEREGTSREKFQGGMISVMSRFPSWSNERKLLTALRGLIPHELSEEIAIATEDYLL